MDKLKIVKFAVVILTFLLVFGMLAALGMIYKKASAPAAKSGTIRLAQPEGSSIEDMITENGTVYLLVKYGGNPDRIIILNPAKTNVSPTIISVN